MFLLKRALPVLGHVCVHAVASAVPDSLRPCGL